MPTPIKAVIFDMDGVLIASEDYWFEARADYMHSLGLVWTMDNQRHCMGVNTIEWARYMKQEFQLDGSLDEIMAEVKRRLIALIEQHRPLLPGATESIHTAASRYRVALASGSPTEVIRSVTKLMGVDTIFETMVFGDDMERGKPNPDIYLETARRLNLSPAECIGVEDSANGVRALHAAGMRIIAVPSPGYALPPDVAALADIALTSLEQFSLDQIARLG